ncbi:electron transport complex subunit RsxC [Marinilabiliaceae bacterium ANBcel2]|nr:electron transport complex subunit RsxC [Marinilabiliaceae bacterium ANBcel2]
MLKTFTTGGVHPNENKITASSAIERVAAPATVSIPVSQHIGAPSEILVKRGDQVMAGELIAKSGGFVSANIHSSVSGMVTKIEDIPSVSGYTQKAVTIKREGDIWDESIDTSDILIKEISLSPSEIIKRVGEAGIVGLGGATFPSHVKLSPPPGKVCEILLINGVECEPFLTGDHRIMVEKGEEVLTGITILMKALGVTKAVIGIENNKPDAIKRMIELSKNYAGIEVQPLKVKYPQGGEKQLIKAITQREVPSGKLPVEVGAVVHNVGTAYAVYEAVQKKKPLIERVVTVTGPTIKKPGNYLVRIGTSVEDLIEVAGGLPDDVVKVVSGGPMMGKALPKLNTPVAKGMSGLLLLPQEITSRKESQNCIKCAKCVSACPMGLSPYLLMTVSQKELFERAIEEDIMDCIECGSCSFTCPSSRPLLDYIRFGKAEAGNILRSKK